MREDILERKERAGYENGKSLRGEGKEKKGGKENGKEREEKGPSHTEC